MNIGVRFVIVALVSGAATSVSADDNLAVGETVFALLAKRADKVKRIEQGPPVAKLDRFGDQADAIGLKNRILADGSVDVSERALLAALLSDVASLSIRFADQVLSVRNLSHPAAKAVLRSIP
jgi:hypothetical protein